MGFKGGFLKEMSKKQRSFKKPISTREGYRRKWKFIKWQTYQLTKQFENEKTKSKEY